MRGGALAVLAGGALLMAALLAPLALPAQGQIARDIDIDLFEFRFDPALIQVEPGDTVTLTVRNIGAIEHTFTLFAERDPDIPENFEEGPLHEFNATAPKLLDTDNNPVDVHVQPGEETTITFVAPVEPGPYVFVCMVLDHGERGMHGVLQVGAEPGISPLLIGVVVAVVVAVVAAAAFFLMRRRAA